MVAGASQFELLLTMESGGHWSASLWRWGLCVTMASLSLWKVVELAVRGDVSWNRVFRKKGSKQQYLAGFPGLVGNTPLVELTSLSKATGCRILVYRLQTVLPWSIGWC
jgi:hypothetical protein